ncbi:TcpE family conjugal transfer membrane protein [Streptococcus pluranimalium]|uniref:TcpE family conjugal transfer membrane protein n=1 Tax=Streptococcus pluranimalium TaxID=82348 RepID=UPI00346513C4
MERNDKKLYSYKQALSQPYWIQRLNDRLNLPSPVKLSRIVYAILLITFFGICF